MTCCYSGRFIAEEYEAVIKVSKASQEFRSRIFVRLKYLWLKSFPAFRSNCLGTAVAIPLTICRPRLSDSILLEKPDRTTVLTDVELDERDVAAGILPALPPRPKPGRKPKAATTKSLPSKRRRRGTEGAEAELEASFAEEADLAEVTESECGEAEGDDSRSDVTADQTDGSSSDRSSDESDPSGDSDTSSYGEEAGDPDLGRPVPVEHPVWDDPSSSPSD